MSKPRSIEAATPVTAQGGQGGRGRGDRGRADRSREREPVRNAELSKLRKEEKAKRPVCDQYRREGKCKAHADGGCKDKKHLDPWRNIGKDAFDGGR